MKKKRDTNTNPYTLLVVESPAKAKTIEKYLGKGYKVEASKGHLIDLPKSRLAVDIEGSFEPDYIVVRGKAPILKALQEKANASSKVLLASDNDREGEAIAYHIRDALLKKNPDLEIGRIVFNEITPQAIREAVEHPRSIDIHKVEAQKARRVLDRLVGYHLSPLLWKKVKNGLSAGRVQSVALRLICEREREVESFVPEEYWTIAARAVVGRSSLDLELVSYKGEKPQIKTEEEAGKIIALLREHPCRVKSLKETSRQVRPKPPFTTSQLQQVAANRLGFSSQKTMQIAQRLYEGVDLGGTRIGLITYMRTDSTRVAESALSMVRNYIQTHHPEALPDAPVRYARGKGAQDAHEAIRPTVVDYTPDHVKQHLSRDEWRLYSIIWERFVASQMKPMVTKTVTVECEVGEGVLRASATQVVEPGFLSVLSVLKPKDTSKKLPPLEEGQELTIEEWIPSQHFTTGPSRYTDATIVKALEELGIGRPSTYAPTIQVLFNRYYVVRKERQIVPTELGKVVNDILVQSFPDILDVDFTARMEAQLDEIEEGKVEWVSMIREFFGPFREKVDHVMEHLESIKGTLEEETGETCEKCGRPMVKKLGRFGYFLACSGFPECRNARPLPLADCPMPGCDGKIVERRGRRGRRRVFYGCTRYPECSFTSPYPPSGTSCPMCGWPLMEKTSKEGSVKLCVNPSCSYLHEREGEVPVVIDGSDTSELEISTVGSEE
ncbi:DNA topoisomerase I [Spirochaeta thermophila DSM 6578]|uniref:DNA topoisomerase 1 n=1 Tax=Winmispira thermophila (strain ATCC 700085 / DSM 6578 / Z-1203) TaxID=869211 RepID=G0GCB7_WINT7|nr:type I DNA topoisomerase [Spirochaeta thermophila]AEJ61202.1 DNA topoisomerase I [Spirochaeta thermophila DSM 6578]